MASGARTRKSTATPELDVANLSTVERLIFAQAVHEFGSGAWPEVAKLLSKHPLVCQPEGTFTPQSCVALYKHLMDDAGLEWSETQTGPRLERNLRLAQKYYVARIKELRELIAAEEQKFKTLVTEIDEIRGGGWDDKIRASMGIEPQTQREEQPESEPEKPLPAELPAVQLEPEEPTVPEADTSAERSREPTLDDNPAPEQPIEAEHPPIDNEEREQEERSDNDAVNELIGHLDSDKPTGDVDAPDDAPSVPTAPEESPAEVEEDEMQVDQVPVKHEEEEADESSPGDSTQEERQSLEPDAEVQELEDADPPSSEPSPLSRVDAKRKASDADSVSLDGQREKKRLREESEPADEDDGLPKTRRKERAGDKRFQNMIGMLHSQISQHRYGNIFHNPIKKSEAPDYHDIVKRPMDLKTIKARVKDGGISTSLEFQRDIFLMFANAMMYNRPGSEIYNMAEEMMVSSEREINAFRQTEGFHRM